jgi:lysophospholipase L1-like esterase
MLQRALIIALVAIAVFAVIAVLISVSSAIGTDPESFIPDDLVHFPSGMFEPDAELGWRVRPELDWFEGHRTNRLGFRGGNFTPQKPAGTFRIVCMGDDTTFGWNLHEAETYPEMLEWLLGRAGGDLRFEVLNLSTPGYTTEQGKRLFQESVLPLQPDLIVLQYGMHDARSAARGKEIDDETPKVSLEDYQKNLEGIIQETRQHGIDVVLIPPIQTWKILLDIEGDSIVRYREIVQRLGEEMGIPVVRPPALEDTDPFTHLHDAGMIVKAVGVTLKVPEPWNRIFFATPIEWLKKSRMRLAQSVMSAHKDLIRYSKAGHAKTAYALYECARRRRFQQLPGRHPAFVVDPGEIRDPALEGMLSRTGWARPFIIPSPMPFRSLAGQEALIRFSAHLSEGTFFLRVRNGRPRSDAPGSRLEILFDGHPLLEIPVEGTWQWLEAALPSAKHASHWHKILFRTPGAGAKDALAPRPQDVQIGCILIEE